MLKMLAGLSRQARKEWRAFVAALVRFWRLLGFGLYVLFWSKILGGRRGVSRLNLGLLASKSVQYLPPQLEVCSAGAPIDAWSHGFAAVNAARVRRLPSGRSICGTRRSSRKYGSCGILRSRLRSSTRSWRSVRERGSSTMATPRNNCFMSRLVSCGVQWCNSILDGTRRRRC
jgi:hypothetical protein